MSECELDSVDMIYLLFVMLLNLKIELDFKEKLELGDIMEIWMFFDRFKCEFFGFVVDVKLFFMV